MWGHCRIYFHAGLFQRGASFASSSRVHRRSRKNDHYVDKLEAGKADVSVTTNELCRMPGALELKDGQFATRHESDSGSTLVDRLVFLSPMQLTRRAALLARFYVPEADIALSRYTPSYHVMALQSAEICRNATAVAQRFRGVHFQALPCV